MPDEPTDEPIGDPTPQSDAAPAGDPPAADPPEAQVAEPEPEPEPQSESEPEPGPRSRWSRLAASLPRYTRRAVLAVCALVAAALVSFVTIDLGPAVRAQAERAASAQLERPVRIGRLGSYLVPGRFLVEDLVIDGLEPGHEPFLVTERIVVTMSWIALLGGEILVDGAEMRNWRMLVESFPDGRHSFPPFAPQRPDDADAPAVVDADAAGPAAEESERLIVTTLRHLVASDGEFVFRDHDAPWDVTARNIDLTIAKRDQYRGDVSFSGGTIQIGSFEPMTADMDASYELDGGQVDLTRINLTMAGFTSRLTGEVDLLNWPEQTYRIIESDIELPPMKDIFFAGDNFTVDGRASFTGAWHIFDGGHELTGRFHGADTTFNDLGFPGIEGSIVWAPDRFEVFDARSGFYGGDLDFDYSMKPLGKTKPGLAAFDVRYRDVDLEPLLDKLAISGVRPAARISGRNLLQWPIGSFADRNGEGRLAAVPAAGVRLMTAAAPRPAAARAAYAAAPFAPDGAPWSFPVGGEVTYSITPEGIEIEPGRLATPNTEIRFQGWTAYGGDSRIPFSVTSADWQESDRLMAAALTAFGVPTGEIAVGGHGRLDGVMLGTFASPRIEAEFEGRDIEAWNVSWGAGRGTITVENAYLDVMGGRFERDAAVLQVDGRFTIGSRDDGGDEIDASFGLASFPAERVRQAFGLSGYDISGALNGEIRLFGRYRSPYGVGRLTLREPVAYGESFESASAGLRFEGTGVRLDGLEVEKAGGSVTGAAFIGWDGTYSFNADGRGIAVADIDAARFADAPLGGVAQFTVEGVGAFDDPRYEVRGLVRDLTIDGEEVGQISGRLDVRGGVMGLEAEAASLQGALSASGRVALATTQSELLFRFTNTTIDPYIRAFRPELSDRLAAEVSGTLEVTGVLRDMEQLQVVATVEQLGLDIYGYSVRNAGTVRFELDRNVVGIEQMRLAGDGTVLDLAGEIGLGDQRLDLSLSGDTGLALFEEFFPDVRSSGNATLVAEIGGTFDQPQVSGEAVLDGGRLRHLSFPHSLENIEGNIVFEPGGIRLDDLSGELGTGTLRFGGRVDVQGYEVGGMNVTAVGTGMRLRFPEGIRSLVDAELTLGGGLEAPVLSGAVSVRDAILLELFGSGPGLFDVGADEAVAAPDPIEPAFPLQLDVRISAPSSLRISDNAARVVSSAELTLGGTYTRPLLFGNAEIENGEVFFEGNRYRVTRGSIAFADPTEIEPVFDVEAETDVRTPGQTYRVTLGLAGTMDRLEFELSSDPPLPEFEIMSLLLGNIRDPQAAELRTLRAQDASRQELFQAGAARLLTTPLSSGVGRVVRNSFGIDTFQITPSLVDPSAQQSAQLLPTARLLIGKRISERAHVTLSRTLTGANQHIIVVLEYDQNDRLSWVLSQNEDRTYALDFRVRHAF
ncbi:MAG: translocation/assembly module TamB domain-containing protein [Acidobacteria bacterium]|nr:translocation/assembly module TamB domain-containing protein [Acidobacteriota bacterium]